MYGMIDGFNFGEMEAMKYYAPPASWPTEKKQSNVHTKIFSNDWGAAEKKDGFFAKIIKDEDGTCILTARNRNTKGEFVNKIEWVPHLKPFFDAIPNGSCLLGELYLPSNPGSKNTQTILGCLKEKAIARQEKGEKIHLYVFDCLAWNGLCLVNRAWNERISYLDDYGDIMAKPYCEVAEFYFGEELWEKLSEILARGGEGIVLMYRDSVYEPGKRSAKTSLKIKKEVQQTIDCFFTGRASAPSKQYTGKEIESWKYWINTATGAKAEGEYYNSYIKGAPIEPVTKPYFYGWAGSLEIAVLKDGKVAPIGFLSGLTDEIRANFRDYENAPIEITCMEVLETGGLRHAKFLNFRPDLKIEDCTWEKIFG